MVEQISSFFDRIHMNGNPVAHPDALIICGLARFTVLTPRLIRLEWSAAGEFEDRGTFAFPNRYAEVPVFSHAEQDDHLEIETDALSLHYTADGQPFHQGNLSIHFDLNGQIVQWQPGMVNTSNLRGTRRTLDQCADAADLQQGLHSRAGWSLFDDSISVLWDTAGMWVEPRPDDPLQDWYFFGYGHDYKAALAEYMRFGGDIPLIPRYVLGGWWSRFWPYSAQDLMDLVEDFQNHDIPLDVLVVDMDWHTPDGWTGYTWNRRLFPDPEAFLAWVHARGLFVTLNLHPAQGVQKHEAIYPQFASRLGQDPSIGEGIKFRAADRNFIQGYFELLHHPLEDQGVDFWWLDWQQGDSADLKGLDPLPWLNHLHFQDSTRRGTRPMLYSRWGGLGNHRYPIGFSGDTYATWESLRFQVYFTQTAANVGYGWWSHDIGGHFHATAPELYARWVQFGAVSPCLRLHSTNDPLAERRPWAFPTEVYQAAKVAFQFRYQLLPYLYSAARHASQKGLSLCTPMYYEYPDSEDAYLARDQYFLGDQMIVAPVTTPADPATGMAGVDVWIPDGTWIDYTTLDAHSGPKWLRVQADLQRIPIFVRSGAILPLALRPNRTRDVTGSHLVLMIFTNQSGETILYEDDGITESYRDGQYETTAIRSLVTDHSITISVAAAEGFCPVLPDQRTFEFRLRGVSQPPSRVTVNGQANQSWEHDSLLSQVTFSLSEIDRHASLEIVLTTPNRFPQLNPPESAPFVHAVDYPTFEEARQQLGTLLIAPPDSSLDAPFDAEIEWELHTESGITARSMHLRAITDRQIISSPFADVGDLQHFRWNVSAVVTWQGGQIHSRYESEDAYPALNRWRALIYNPNQHPLTIADLLSAEGSIDRSLPWMITTQKLSETPNLKQPYGMVLLEHERERILSGEPLAACLTTTLTNSSPQEAVLYVQSVGEAAVYLNGIELTPTEPVPHTVRMPMFYSWMPPTQVYYAFPLNQGENQLTIFTRPHPALGWWGVGALLFDRSGKGLLLNGKALP